MHKIPCYIDEEMVLHVAAKDTMDSIVLKYFTKELATHGLALINIETDPGFHKKIHAEKHAKPVTEY